jgi:uncharacterized protein (DUF169 family)
MKDNIYGNKLSDLLGLEMAPVAISFRTSAPEGVRQIQSPGPSSCSYWKLAAEGETFYTDANDHLNCTIGAYTHNVEMPAEKMEELQSMVGEMVKLNYISMEEVPAIPRQKNPFGVAVYAPLAETPTEPDVVIIRGNAKQIMLLTEAVKATNIEHNSVTIGRPTCAMIPLSMQSESGVSSFGCIGNRVYTGLGENELYFTIPGKKVSEVIQKLDVICQANRELDAFHHERAAAAASES